MELVAVVRGGGDLATGVVQKLWRAGFKVAVLEVSCPLAIRRTVSLCRAVSDGIAQVEDMTAVGAQLRDCAGIWERNEIPVLIDPDCETLSTLEPVVLVDAIMAKRNLGTNCKMAPVTIALGPGFTAPDDVDAVIETKRGHNLGRMILRGEAQPNTGIPGELGGKSVQRVVHSPESGRLQAIARIGDQVKAGQPIFSVTGEHGETIAMSPLDGVLRGLIASGIEVKKGLKCADVDPRSPDETDFLTISDKARCIGGAVLEAALYLMKMKTVAQLW